MPNHERKTELCRHHVDQLPPLMLQTVPVHYHCVLPCKLSVSFDQSGTSGAQVFLGPLCGKLSSVQSAPSISLSHSPHRLGHYWIVRDGFGGHVIHRLHQTFIPASNSTTVRGERPDSKGQWIESRQSVTSNPMNGKQTWSTTLIKPPPLLLPTIPGPLIVN